VPEQIRPAHYGGPEDPYETIKVIRAWGLNFELGNVAKYLSRAGKKPGVDAVDDLRKLVTYAQMEIERTSRNPVALYTESFGGPGRIGAVRSKIICFGLESRIATISDHKGCLTVSWRSTPKDWEKALVEAVWLMFDECQVEHETYVPPKPAQPAPSRTAP
jgi:hypothetical protein